MVTNLPLGIMRKTSDGVYGYTRLSTPEFQNQMPQLDLNKSGSNKPQPTGIVYQAPDGMYCYRAVPRPEFQDLMPQLNLNNQ